MIAGVVLAGGMSRRMGRNKLLLPLGGRPLLAHALAAMTGSEADEVWCVLGHESESVRAAMGEEAFPRPIGWVVNGAYASGRSSSIRAALAAIPGASEGVVFLPGDVPGVTAEDIDEVIRAFRRTGAPVAVATREDGTRSHPVLFGKELFPRLSSLEGDTGGRPIVDELWASAAKVPRPAGHAGDVDTVEDYGRALANPQFSPQGVGP